MMYYSVSDKNIRYRYYPCPISFVFDTHLSVFASENTRICIRIRSYPYSNSNPNENMKTNMVLVISVRIRSDYTPTRTLLGGAWSLFEGLDMSSWELRTRSNRGSGVPWRSGPIDAPRDVLSFLATWCP
jgi:hypothetical protein